MHARVGQCELRGVYGHVAVENQVNVDGAVAICAVGIAVGVVGAELCRHSALHLLYGVEQFRRGEVALDVNADVEERIGGIKAPGLALHKRGAAAFPGRQREKPGDSRFDYRAAVAEI